MSDSVVPQKTTPRLHESLAIQDIEQIREKFELGRQIQPHELRKLLYGYRIAFTEEQFKTVFLRMDSCRDNLCDWDEFISYLINGFRNDDPYGQKESLNLPIVGHPLVRKAIHRYPIVRIRFCPTVLLDRTVNNTNGSYITTSKDGTVIYWTQDFVMQRVCKSKNPNLKVSKTWVLDCIPMPDVRIVCTSSIERDLRFYDTTANNFHPRIIVTRMPYEVHCMAYWFGDTEDIDCRLIVGDAGGNLALLEFNPELRGPFQSKPGAALRQLTWADLCAGQLAQMRVTRLPNVHRDVVRQVEFSETLNAIFSAAECRSIPLGRTPAPGLVISDLGVQKTQTVFRMTKGVTCFAVDRTNTIIATGGPDCMLRLWNHIMPGKPQAILPGHHSGIVYIFLQDDAHRIYSVDRTRIVKVWDTVEQKLLQTFIAFGTAIVDRVSVACFYNDNTRDLTLASMRLVTVKCCPLLKLDKTDGYTHTKTISVILYNELFRSVITCGYDSIIIVWDPWTGRRQTLIKHAHTRMVHGAMLRVEVTSACFDPQQQLLLTGARDGTMKVWNFNSGVCVRNLSIEPMCEVTNVFWFRERILAVGWNRHVTEFSDTKNNELGDGKHWDTCHTEDILATAVRSPQTLATSSYSGELVFWKLETGQPYRMFNVENPKSRIQITYDGLKVKLMTGDKYDKSKSRSQSYVRRMFRSRNEGQSVSARQSIRQSIRQSMMGQTEMPNIYKMNRSKSASRTVNRNRLISIVQLPAAASVMNKTAVNVMLFLPTRPMDDKHGTLLIALSTGIIQMFTHHPQAPGYFESFNAIHMAGDSVVSMVTDKADRLLITGTSLGYIKTWLICNFCIPKEEQQHINMPELRLQFPFMLQDKFMGRAKRTVRALKNPLLVNSFKAHLASVITLIYMETQKLVLSGSPDTTTRIWTLGGRYIGTLGSPVGWPVIDPMKPIPEDFAFRMPPDVKRVASSTTFKVYHGGNIEDPMMAMIMAANRRARELESEVRAGESLKVYGESLTEPILGKDLELPEQEAILPKCAFDTTMLHVPVYTHLKYTPADMIVLPKMPETLRQCRKNQQNELADDAVFATECPSYAEDDSTKFDGDAE